MKNHNIISIHFLVALCLSFCSFTLKAENKIISNLSADVWEVEIVKKTTNEVVVHQVVAINSFPLEGLEENTEYYARVRTKNIVYSGWVTSDVFTYNTTTGILHKKNNEDLIIRSAKGRIIISSTVPHDINIYNVNGCLIRSVGIVNGETVIVGLEKGVYLANNQKFIVE